MTRTDKRYYILADFLNSKDGINVLVDFQVWLETYRATGEYDLRMNALRISEEALVVLILRISDIKTNACIRTSPVVSNDSEFTQYLMNKFMGTALNIFLQEHGYIPSKPV